MRRALSVDETILEIGSIEKNRAAGGTVPRIETAQKCRFAAAVRTDHRELFAEPDRKINPIQDRSIRNGEPDRLGDDAGCRAGRPRGTGFRSQVFRDVAHGGAPVEASVFGR
jgi:hypothetical protein